MMQLWDTVYRVHCNSCNSGNFECKRCLFNGSCFQIISASCEIDGVCISSSLAMYPFLIVERYLIIFADGVPGIQCSIEL